MDETRRPDGDGLHDLEQFLSRQKEKNVFVLLLG
jgi:hypothetical protein